MSAWGPFCSDSHPHDSFKSRSRRISSLLPAADEKRSCKSSKRIVGVELFWKSSCIEYQTSSQPCFGIFPQVAGWILYFMDWFENLLAHQLWRDAAGQLTVAKDATSTGTDDLCQDVFEIIESRRLEYSFQSYYRDWRASSTVSFTVLDP